MKEFENSIREMVSWFTKNDIKFAIIGGIAVSFQTIERTTKDDVDYQKYFIKSISFFQ